MGAVAAFIPAKMTSQRVPEKNMRQLGDRPLMYYSVRAAQLAQGIDRVVVSSESDIILDYAAELGAEPRRREPELAAPEVRNFDVLRAWLESIAEPPELIVLLQPTHPFRLPSDLSAAVRLLADDPTADSVLALAPHNHLVGALEDGWFTAETAQRGPAAGCQLYRNTGAFYVLRSKRTICTGSLLGQRVRGYPLPYPELEVDINQECDLLYAEALLKARGDMLTHFD